MESSNGAWPSLLRNWLLNTSKPYLEYENAQLVKVSVFTGEPDVCSVRICVLILSFAYSVLALVYLFSALVRCQLI